MEFKLSEIILIVLALAIPVGLFTILLIPGAMDAVYNFLLEPSVRPVVFFGGAGIAFGVLAWRIYSRVRPPQKPPAPKAPPAESRPHNWPKV